MSERAIFLAALEIAEREARAAYLDEACAGDCVLRARVDALLKSHEDALRQQKLGQGDTEKTASSAPSPEESADVASTLTAPHMSEGPGSVIGPYKLLQKLGEGGMGVVYLAEQREPVARKVALKIIKPGMDSAQVIARFEHERQALAMMDHPNIAKVLDAGTTEAGRPFFVMELVKGIPITRFCDQEHLTPRERLELFIPVCHAAQHAHQKGIIHRDLKPSNVLVALYDGKAVPKIIDFGVAKATSQRLTERTMYTAVGSTVGTLEYMAPEQAELNNLDIDTRADIYSLGAILYELLTGAPPFTSRELRGAAFTEMMRIIREVEPAKPSTKVSSSAELPSIAAARKVEPKRLTKLLSGDMDWIVMKCLEKDRARRYETANGLAADLLHYLVDEPVLAGPPSTTYRLRKFLRRKKGPVLAATLVCVAVLIGAVIATWQAMRANRERDEKQQALEAEMAARKQAMSALSSLTEDIVERQLTRQVTLSEADREFLKEIVAQYEAFAALRGDREENRAIRAEGYHRVGVLRHRLGELAETRASYERAQELYGQLVADFPSTPEYRHELGKSHVHLGNLLLDLGKRAEAEAEFRHALSLLKQLADLFPAVPDYRRDLATSHSNLGRVLPELGKHAEAETEYR